MHHDRLAQEQKGHGIRRLMIAAAVLVVVVGCATGPRTTPGPCLPPGIAADVFLWSVVETGTAGMVPVEGGGTMRIVYVLYQRADRRVAVGWVGGQILLVDPEPDSAAAPWFNERFERWGRELDRDLPLSRDTTCVSSWDVFGQLRTNCW